MTANTIAIIDYGMGNLHSVHSAVELVAPETKVVVTDDAQKILKADRVIFPGVGAIRDCMAEIKNRGLDSLIKEVAQAKPLLGICVGMQAMMTSSEENNGVDCLNILPGQVKLFEGSAFEGEQKLKVPHMGWNKVEQKIEHPMFNKIEQGARCYFVHSYYVDCADRSFVAAQSGYGQDFDSVLCKDNIFAVQFHPEKSHKVGLQLLKNFSEWKV